MYKTLNPHSKHQFDMKIKILIAFVLGLFAWLLATNYQTVYSKVTNFIQPEAESVEIIADETPADIATKANTDENDAAVENENGIDGSSSEVAEIAKEIPSEEVSEEEAIVTELSTRSNNACY